LSTLVSVLVALSVASERLVEIVKGLSSWLNDKKDKADEERHRKLVIQVLAVAAGLVTALLTKPAIQEILPQWANLPGILALGLLASGGSGFWNSAASYVAKLKDLKKLEVAEKESIRQVRLTE
jgi:membrane protein required for beta-lactamase induction